MNIRLLLLLLVMFLAPIFARAASSAVFQLQIQNGGSSVSNVGGGNVNDIIAQRGTYRFSGNTYPEALIAVTQNGTKITEVSADNNGFFSGEIGGLSYGLYSFGFMSMEDDQSSIMITRSSQIGDGSIELVDDGITIPPSVIFDKDQAARNSSFTVKGRGPKGYNISILMKDNSGLVVREATQSISDDGGYAINIGVSGIDDGDYFIEVYFNNQLIIAKDFSVSDKDLFVDQEKCRIADLNCDQKVNIVDFSIAAFWYKRELSGSFSTIERELLNGDGVIDLTDFSIMAYYWTG